MCRGAAIGDRNAEDGSQYLWHGLYSTGKPLRVEGAQAQCYGLLGLRGNDVGMRPRRGDSDCLSVGVLAWSEEGVLRSLIKGTKAPRHCGGGALCLLR